MSRHQNHLRLLRHLNQHGYVLTWVSNGASSCRGKIVEPMLPNQRHMFGMTKKWNTYTPPLVQIRKGMTPHLSFRIEGKDGDVQHLLGWKRLAAFVNLLNIEKQREESRKKKEAVV